MPTIGDHLNLQIDLLAEKEITKILEMQRQLCEHFGIVAGNDAEASRNESAHSRRGLGARIGRKATGRVAALALYRAPG